MSEPVKETQCTYCIHKDICCHKVAFLNAIENINNVYVDGTGWVKDIPWLNVDFNCKHHYPEPIATKRYSEETDKLAAQMKFDEAVKKVVSEPLIAHVPRRSGPEEGAEWLL